jgi:Ser/Thr protein kinase RdoA (MazF antagonist)
VAHLEVVAHAYNTTFRADTVEGTTYALRVGTNSHSTPRHVVAQQAWQQAIAAETDVLVAAPLAASDGMWCVETRSEAFGRPVLVTAATWLAGPDVVEMDAELARRLGRTMAVLHDQSSGWAPPPDGEMPRLDAPLFGDEDLLTPVSLLTGADRRVLDEAMARSSAAFAAAYDGAPVRPLHADLHGGNLKWDGDRLAVFDFDDCGLGLPALDLAIAVFYLRGGDPALEASLREGYAEVGRLPDVDPAHFEAMLAARQLLLANSLLASTTAELRRDAGRYLELSVARLRHWLETGTFTRAVG